MDTLRQRIEPSRATAEPQAAGEDARTGDTDVPDESAPAKPHIRRRSRLVRRTFLIALVLVSAGLLSSAALEIVFRYRENVADIWALQREMAQGAAFKIQQFVHDIEKTLYAGTQTEDMVHDGLTEAYRFQLLKLLKTTPAITGAVAVDADGLERFKVSRLEMIAPDDLGHRTSDEAFLQSRRGGAYFGPVYFVSESEPYMRMAVPIEPFAGDVIGVLIAEVNLKYIWDVISQIRVGQSGYAYVVSADGDLIAHPDISLVFQKQNLRHLAQVQAALTGAPGPLSIQPNLTGERVFPAYESIPELGWAVLVERPAGEAYAPLYASVLRTASLLALGLVIAVLASFMITRRVVRPLQLVQQSAERIGAGDLGHRIEVHTGDEIEALASEFNRMTLRLRESYADLERKVDTRTSELARSVEQLQALAEVSRTVNSTLDLETVLTAIVARAVQLAEANGGVVYEYDEPGETFVMRANRGAEPEIIDALTAAPIRLGEGVLGEAAATRAPVQVPDLAGSSASVLARVRKALVALGYRSLLSLPLLLEERIMGGLVIWRRDEGEFPDAVVHLLQTFATQSTLAIRNARLFRAIEKQAHELELASKHKSQFLANMSHELRTPLNAVIGFSQVLQERMFGELNDKQAEYIEDIHFSGQHLLSLINDILDLSKIEAGQMQLDLNRFDVDTALDNAITLVRERAARRTIALETDIAPALGSMVADERKLKQILLNLLSNAIKFTPDGGEVRVSAMRRDGALEVAVRDNGIGIAPEDQAVIFEEFQQVGGDHAHKAEGTGLGLTLTKRFVEMHGGSIRVDSAKGKGSTFTLWIPLAPPSPDMAGFTTEDVPSAG